MYGNPLCTQYQTDEFGNILLNDDGTPNPIVFANGGFDRGALSGTESTCLSDHYGDIVIPNMGPNRYAVTVVPPDPRTHNGDTWVRTTTLEGGHDWDAWLIEGIDGYDTELVVGGERVPPVIAGFVKLTNNDQVWANAEAAGTNSAAERAYYDASARVPRWNRQRRDQGHDQDRPRLHRFRRRHAVGRHQPRQCERGRPDRRRRGVGQLHRNVQRPDRLGRLGGARSQRRHVRCQPSADGGLRRGLLGRDAGLHPRRDAVPRDQFDEPDRHRADGDAAPVVCRL